MSILGPGAWGQGPWGRKLGLKGFLGLGVQAKGRGTGWVYVLTKRGIYIFLVCLASFRDGLQGTTVPRAGPEFRTHTEKLYIRA